MAAAIVGVAAALAFTALGSDESQASAGAPNSVASVRSETLRAPAAPAPAPDPTIDLCAKEGTTTIPGASTVAIWGFALKPDGVPCSDESVVAQLPGPPLVVNEGDAVTVNLYNELTVNLSIVFPQVEMLPDTLGAAPGGSANYSFSADRPGTFLYEAGTVAQESGMGPSSCSDGINNDEDEDSLVDGDDPECTSAGNSRVQVAMGLYGALIIRPSDGASFVYDDPDTAFDAEAVLVLSEIDPDLNADPFGFDMDDYDPHYWLINGKAYPDTSEILADAGSQVVFRYLNAGLTQHTMEVVGFHQAVIAGDAYPLNYSYEAVSLTVASGQTFDTIGTVPAAPSGTQYTLYNANLHVTNGSAFPGGMLTFVTVAP